MVECARKGADLLHAMDEDIPLYVAFQWSDLRFFMQGERVEESAFRQLLGDVVSGLGQVVGAFGGAQDGGQDRDLGRRECLDEGRGMFRSGAEAGAIEGGTDFMSARWQASEKGETGEHWGDREGRTGWILHSTLLRHQRFKGHRI